MCYFKHSNHLATGNKVRTRVKQLILYLRKKHWMVRKRQILKDNKHRKDFHEQYVLVPADKATNNIYSYNYVKNHKGDRYGAGWPPSLPYIRKIRVSVVIGTQFRNPSSQKGTYGQNMGVLKKCPNLAKGKVAQIIKVHFHFFVILLLQFQLTYLKNRTELRNETLHTDRTP